MISLILSAAKVATLCAQLAPAIPYRMAACAVVGGELCLIIVPGDVQPSEFSRLWRHEAAHCRGMTHAN